MVYVTSLFRNRMIVQVPELLHKFSFFLIYFSIVQNMFALLKYLESTILAVKNKHKTKETNWCLNRHLCILPERFAKKDLNLVIVCRKDVTS